MNHFKKITFILILSNLLSCINDEGQRVQLKKSETFYTSISNEPENLHPIKSTDYYSTIVQSYILESLLERHPDTYKLTSQLAKKWKTSPNGKTFTFTLHKGLKWSDGNPLTAKDVKFSFEAYINPEYGGIHFIPYLENIKSATVINDQTIVFKTKDLYFKNFEIVATLPIIPQHIYKDPKAKLSKTIFGSGPYKISKYHRGKMLILSKNENWQGQKFPLNKRRWKFKNITIRFIKEETDKLLRLQKEDIDYSNLTANSFEQKTSKAPWGTKVLKFKIKNKSAKGYGFVGFNFKKELFQDKKVRKALAHAFNRDLMNKKFLFGHGLLASGPWYSWSDYADSKVKPIPFNLKKASQLLKQAGWRDENKDGTLEKKWNKITKNFSFTVIFSNKESEKYLTLYQEDLKKIGVKLSLKLLDWTSFLKILDDKKFDAVMLGWGGGSVDLDPKQIWHTQSSLLKGGSNFISYSNPKVDKLIDKGRTQLNKRARIKAFQKVYRLIAEDVPYIFLFNSPHYFYGVNRRIERPKPTLIYFLGHEYWSLKK